MKICVLGDMHVTPIGEYSPMLGGYESEKLNRFKDTIEWADVLLAQEIKPDKVVLVGDLFSENGYIDPVAKAVIDRVLPPVIQRWTNAGMQVYILTGNHEMFDKRGFISILQYFEHFAQECYVITKPEVLDGVLFVPYVYHDEYPKVLELFNSGRFKYAFTHLDFLGAGMTPKIRANKGIDINAITSKIQIINGHYHHPEIINLVAGGGMLTNVGSMYHIDHGDGKHSVTRGVLQITDVGQELSEYVIYPNPYTDFYSTVRERYLDKINEELRKLIYPDRTRVKIFTNSLDVKDVSQFDSYGFKSVKLFKRTTAAVEEITVDDDAILSVDDATRQYIDSMQGEFDKPKLTDVCLNEILGNEN